MTPQAILDIVLTVVLVALAGAAIWAVVVLVRTLRSVDRLATDLDTRLIPLLDSAAVTIEAVNAELLRIDAIVDRFEEVSETVSSTTRAAHEAIQMPVEKLVAARGRISRLVSVVLGNTRK